MGLVAGCGHRHRQVIQGRAAADHGLAPPVIRGDHPIRVDVQVQFTLVDDPAPRLRVVVRRCAACQVYGLLDDLGRNSSWPWRSLPSGAVAAACIVDRRSGRAMVLTGLRRQPPIDLAVEQGPKAPSSEDLRPSHGDRRTLSHVGWDREDPGHDLSIGGFHGH